MYSTLDWASTEQTRLLLLFSASKVSCYAAVQNWFRRYCKFHSTFSLQTAWLSIAAQRLRDNLGYRYLVGEWYEMQDAGVRVRQKDMPRFDVSRWDLRWTWMWMNMGIIFCICIMCSTNYCVSGSDTRLKWQTGQRWSLLSCPVLSCPLTRTGLI